MEEAEIVQQVKMNIHSETDAQKTAEKAHSADIQMLEHCFHFLYSELVWLQYSVAREFGHWN